MKYRINNQVVLSQPPFGPLAAQIGSFADFISAQGYALYSIHRQVRLAADFSQWLKLKGVELDPTFRTPPQGKNTLYCAHQLRTLELGIERELSLQQLQLGSSRPHSRYG